MTLKSDVKFKEKLPCDFKYYMRNLVNFHPEELSFMTLNSGAKFE